MNNRQGVCFESIPKRLLISHHAEAGGGVGAEHVRYPRGVEAVKHQIVAVEVVVGGGGSGGQIGREVVVDDVVGGDDRVGNVEIGIEGVRLLVIPGHVGVIPLTVQLHHIPAVGLRAAGGRIQAVAGDVPGGDAHRIEQQLIGAGIAGADGTAAHQRAVGVLVHTVKHVGDGVGRTVVEDEALIVIALTLQIGGQGRYLLLQRIAGGGQGGAGHMIGGGDGHRRTVRGGTGRLTGDPEKLGVVPMHQIEYGPDLLPRHLIGVVAQVDGGLGAVYTGRDGVVGIQQGLGVVHLRQNPPSVAGRLRLCRYRKR